MLVNFNVPSQFIQFFALLRTSRSRAVLFLAFFLILLLCASRTLLLFELVHASDPLHDLRVFVLLSTTHTFSFQLCFAINDVFFQLFQLAPLCGADASTLLFFLVSPSFRSSLLPPKKDGKSRSMMSFFSCSSS